MPNMSDELATEPLSPEYMIPIPATVTSAPTVIWLNVSDNAWSFVYGPKSLPDKDPDGKSIDDILLDLFQNGLTELHDRSSDQPGELCPEDERKIGQMVASAVKGWMETGRWSIPDAPMGAGERQRIPLSGTSIVVTRRPYVFLMGPSLDGALDPTLWNVKRECPSRVSYRAGDGDLPGHITYHTHSTVSEEGSSGGIIEHLIDQSKEALSKRMVEQFTRLLEKVDPPPDLSGGEESLSIWKGWFDMVQQTETFWNHRIVTTRSGDGGASFQMGI